MRRLLPAAALLLMCAACAGRAPRPRPGARADPGAPLTPAFEGMRQILLRAEARRDAGDVAGLRALDRGVTVRGLALLKANLPHDLRDGDLERFLDARTAFGQALKAWAYAHEAARPALLFDAIDQLLETYWAWVDATRGLPPERSV